MKRVLVAVDGAKGSRACIDACVSLFAGRTPPAVTLLHVLRYGGPSAVDGLSSDAELAELRQALEGTPQLEALKAKAELIVIGNTRSLMDKLMLGDVAHQVSNGATIPVLLAR